MQTQHPISPPLSNAGDHKTTFNEGPHNSSESPFLRAQYTPESAFGEPQGDQKLPLRTLEMNIELDNAALSRAMEPYPTTNVYAPACQNDYAQMTSIPQPQFFGTSQPAMSVTPTAGNTTSTGDMTDSSAQIIYPNALAAPTVPQGRARTRIERPARVRKQRTKKKTPPKSDKSALNSSVPLSELTKSLGGHPDDTEAFVHRSAEVRQEEVQRRRQCKIPRPMNSFMLYRRAYSEKAKEWCAQNNHQIVSKATAESWRIENKGVRDFFNRMAAIERDNHKKAHPTYKFTPNKNGNVSKKARKKDYDEGMSDVDDFEYDMKPDPDQLAMNSGRLTCDGCIHSRTPTPFEQDSSYGSRHVSPFDQGRGALYRPSDINKSSWANINPGRPVPGMFSSPEQSHYYQSSIQQSSLGPNIEDVTYRRMNVPGGGGGMQYDTSGALTGIPGGPHPELLQPQPQLASHAGTPGSMESAQVDPQLLHANGLGIDLSQAQDGQFAPQNLDPWQPFQENQHYTHSTSNGTTVRTQNGGDQYFAPPGYHYPALAPGLDGEEIWGDAQVGVAPAGFDEWINGQSAY